MLLKYLTLSATAVYLTGVLVGFYMDPPIEAANPKAALPFQLLEQSKGEQFYAIAGNNITVALINLLGGFSLGILSLLNTFYNGVVLGYAFSVAVDHFPVAEILGHLLPHAIEIVAIILSCSLGFYIGSYFIKKLLLDKASEFDYRLFTFQTALTIVIILAAAFLEVYISFS